MMIPALVDQQAEVYFLYFVIFEIAYVYLL